ncbi:hypothetical protein Tco_0326954 [Tanacetum coccineum]
MPEARSLIVDDLLHMVPTLITKVDSLETKLKQTKQTMGKAIVKLVKKVKKLENILKRRNVVLTTSEDEEPEDQGRIFKDIDDDPLVSFVTPTKPSREAQEEEISPTTLEAAKTLSNVASQRSKSVDKGKRYKRRKEFKGKDFEDISTGFGEVNTGGLGFSTGSGLVSSDRGQMERKAQMIVEETQAPKRTKEQIQQEEASLAEAIRLQNLEDEETAKQVHLDALLAKRLAEEEELSEQQNQRRAQVQFKAQHYTEEDWDAIKRRSYKIVHDCDEEICTDSDWSLPGQQKILSWRYYETCRVHCLNLDSADIYMLEERKYPLSANVCQTMLKMKILDGKMNEDCYKLLKMMEKQAGVRK